MCVYIHIQCVDIERERNNNCDCDERAMTGNWEEIKERKKGS